MPNAVLLPTAHSVQNIHFYSHNHDSVDRKIDEESSLMVQEKEDLFGYRKSWTQHNVDTSI